MLCFFHMPPRTHLWQKGGAKLNLFAKVSCHFCKCKLSCNKTTLCLRCVNMKLTMMYKIIIPYHFLAAVDLPFFLGWQSEHVSPVFICKAQLILARRNYKRETWTEKKELKGQQKRLMSHLVFDCKCSEQDIHPWSCTHHELCEHGV